MNLIYKDTLDFKESELSDLFLSVDWESGRYPLKLKDAFHNYSKIYSCYDDERLVGLIAAMDDKVMTSYIHYLLVNPNYQGKGIGKKLVDLMKEYYKDYLRVVLVAYNDKVPFYLHCGFVHDENKKALSIDTFE